MAGFLSIICLKLFHVLKPFYLFSTVNISSIIAFKVMKNKKNTKTKKEIKEGRNVNKKGTTPCQKEK